MKWFGYIAYSREYTEEPGVYENDLLVKPYYGDVIKLHKKDATAQQITNNFGISDQLSVISDPYLVENFHKIAYVTYLGIKWRVSSVDVDYPRVTLSFGEVYVEEEGEESL